MCHAQLLGKLTKANQPRRSLVPLNWLKLAEGDAKPCEALTLYRLYAGAYVYTAYIGAGLRTLYQAVGKHLAGAEMKPSAERLLILVLVGLLIWFGSAIIRLENYRYAASLGMCSAHHPDLVKVDDCLRSKETRTHRIWHLIYGLRLL